MNTGNQTNKETPPEAVRKRQSPRTPFRHKRAAVDKREAYFTATQWKLIWLKLRRHRWAIAGGTLIVVLYTMAIFNGFFEVNGPIERRVDTRYLPPTRIHLIDNSGHFRPVVYRKTTKLDMKLLERVFTEDKSAEAPLKIFVLGDEYKLLGLFRSRLHLIGTGNEDIRFYPFGTDGSGRCVYSRIVRGSTLSLSIGLMAIMISWLLGILIGGISGFFGGVVDSFIQRFIEVLMSFPSLPLWMALSASLPLHWSVVKVYFAITLILSIMGWTGLARTVRSKFLALREEEYVLAAKLDGARTHRLILRHMLPSFASHLIVQASNIIPGMILGETALSFIGVGLRPPAISWGVLLQGAQNVDSIALRPWLLIPAAYVIVTVVAFQFFGDGLRDAVDPYR